MTDLGKITDAALEAALDAANDYRIAGPGIAGPGWGVMRHQSLIAECESEDEARARLRTHRLAAARRALVAMMIGAEDAKADPGKAKWTLDGFTFTAADCRDGVLIDPDLPPRFDATANETRPTSHRKFWDRPYIVTQDGEHPGFVVRCLDGGAWDRSTNWGKFPTLEEAVAQAKAGSPY